MEKAKPKYIAIVGCNNYHGFKIFKPNMIVKLIKEPDNDFDDEAIEVITKEHGKVGYVANSVHTVPRGCMSAGRIYDTFDKSVSAIVKFVTSSCVIAKLIDNRKQKTSDLKNNQ